MPTYAIKRSRTSILPPQLGLLTPVMAGIRKFNFSILHCNMPQPSHTTVTIFIIPFISINFVVNLRSSFILLNYWSIPILHCNMPQPSHTTVTIFIIPFISINFVVNLRSSFILLNYWSIPYSPLNRFKVLFRTVASKDIVITKRYYQF